MDRLVLHKLPREQSKAERGSVPIDRRVDVDGLQCGEQVSLLVVKRGEERLPSQRADIVLVFARPDFAGGSGVKSHLFSGDCTYEIGGQAMEHLAIPYKVIDRHGVILAARFTTGCQGWRLIFRGVAPRFARG